MRKECHNATKTQVYRKLTYTYMKNIAEANNIKQHDTSFLDKGSIELKGPNIHFIGIGGIGMSGIASILLRLGFRVSGSDIKEGSNTRKLKSLGINVAIGHDASYAKGADTVIYSSAIKRSNPELKWARENNVPVVCRAQALSVLMDNKVGIAVSGAHGKTTTTALCAQLLLQSGFFPTAAIGGILRNLDDNAYLGASKYFVAEADESDGTFLYYNPHYSIVTNIDREHLDYYKSMDNLYKAFGDFISRTKEGGCVFCCGDDLSLRRVCQGKDKRIVYYGLSESNDFYAKDIVLEDFLSTYSCFKKGKMLGKITLPLSGAHNIQNSLGVIALGCELGISFMAIGGALKGFKGTERRFQLKAEKNGIMLIDDYGHHPSEVRATLKAASNVAHKRLIVLFQPHRYSRTKLLMEEFAGSFRQADYLVLADIYPASEEPIPGVSSQALANRILELYGQQVVCLKKDELLGHIIPILKPGDLVLTLGAGDIGKISDELAQWLKR